MPLPARLLPTDRGDAGRRLDLVITRHLTDLPRATRTRVQAWIEAGRVSVNGSVIRRVSTRVALGDAVTVSLPDESSRQPMLAEEGPLDILFEDAHILIVNKPAGIVSHPTFLHPSGSLLNAVLWHARTWQEGQRPSLVGRLDEHTSGAVVVAKSTSAHARLQRVLSTSSSEKEYLAVVYGPVPRERGTIDLPLRRHPDDRRRVITSTDGSPSVTRFERVDERRSPAVSVALMRCRLVTGRMHQIRVHMAASGWPIVGDAKYGERRWEDTDEEPLRSTLQSFPRQALHAWRVSFAHPFLRSRVEVTAPLPDDISALLGVCDLASDRQSLR